MRLEIQSKHLMHWHKRIVISGLVGITLCFSSCLINNNLTNLTGGTSTTSTATTTAVAFTLSQVLEDATNPTTVLDLIGDGSNAIGNNCGGTSSSSTTSLCNCSYTYTTNGSTQSFETPSIYVEQNMMRCQYSGVPSGVTTLSVEIHVLASNAYTNSVSFSYLGTGVTVDPTQISSFLQVSRFQCRDILYIPHLFDGNLYDALQSEDPTLTFPFDFYTTDFGVALQSYINAGTSVSYWNCPTNPSLYANYTLNGGGSYANLPSDTTFIFSVGDNGRMYPPPAYTATPASASQLDRSTFYVASAPSGVFSVPLDAYIGPTVVTAYGSTPAPLGYGAAPIPTGIGTEQCPSSSIPQGYHWVKVWLFRADLPARHYLSSSTLTEVGQISCNRQWAGVTGNAGDAGKNVFIDCGAAAATNPLPATATGALANRIIANGPVINGTETGGCINMENPANSPCGTLGAGCTSSAATTQRAGYTAYGYGTDFMQYVNAGACTNPAPFTDALGLCTNNHAGATSGVPADKAPITTAVPNDTTRYDFIFTVSPDISWAQAPAGTAINSGDMEAGTGAANLFTPYRYKTSADCPALITSTNGAACTVTGTTNIIEPYGLKLHDVGTNGDPPASDPNRAGVFPMCAIQPD